MAKDALVSIEWIGPIRQDSPIFGPLEPGERYQCDADFATYLCKAHPDCWRRPGEKKPAAPLEA